MRSNKPPSGGSQKPISALSWWKILDNLRRSGEPILLLALLVGAWFLLSPAGITAVTGLVIATGCID